MNVEPAHIDQIRQARDGRMILIDADVGGVVADLKKMDPSLNVRFAEAGNPPFFAVYHEETLPNGDVTHHLVLTQRAHQGQSGTWLGLDQRIVKRVMEIDARNGYDYAAEIAKQNAAAEKAKKDAFRERTGELGERAAHALRKDLGIKRRAFVNK